MKKLPYDRTVVTECKIQIADLLTRSVVLRSSVAAPIAKSSPYNQGDAIISLGAPLNVQSAKHCVILSSFENFEVVFPGPVEVVLPCTGLFVHYGSLDRLVVRPPLNVEFVRLQYIWA